MKTLRIAAACSRPSSQIARRLPLAQFPLSRSIHTSPSQIEPASSIPPSSFQHSPSTVSVSKGLPQHASSTPTPNPDSPFANARSINDAELPHLLPALAAQTPQYATILIWGKQYLVTEGDIVRLPFLMHGVQPGDVLRLNRISLLGSRDFTLHGRPYIRENLFECRAIVMGVETEPLRKIEKTKRRQRKVKTITAKLRYTEIRIKDLRVRHLDEVDLDEVPAIDV